MTLHILYIYAQGFAIAVGGYQDPELCWEITHQLKSVEIVSDCREMRVQSPLAPSQSLRPVLRPKELAENG